MFVYVHVSVCVSPRFPARVYSLAEQAVSNRCGVNSIFEDPHLRDRNIIATGIHRLISCQNYHAMITRSVMAAHTHLRQHDK